MQILLFQYPSFITFVKKRLNAIVGLSNKLDSELIGKKPVKRPHGQVVGTAIVDGNLLCEIVQRIEGMAEIEAFPVLAMAALDFAVMARGIRTADDAGVQSCPGLDFCGACPG